MLVEVTGIGDPALHDYVGLTDVALRTRAEPERGLFIAESEKVIRRALAASGWAAGRRCRPGRTSQRRRR